MKSTNIHKIKKRFACVVLVVGIAALVGGCAEKKNDEIENLAQLNSSDYVISIDAGAVASVIVPKMFPNAKIVTNTSNADAYLAVEQGKSDGFASDRLYLEEAVVSESLDDLAIMDELLSTTDVGIGLQKDDDTGLKEELNKCIKKLKDDGTLDDMQKRWLLIGEETMPDIPEPTNPTRTLRVGTSGLVKPMNYYDGNKSLTGFDVEFVKRLAVELNAKIILEGMSYDALISSLESGKLDMVVADLNVTEEREQVIDFTDSYIKCQTAMIVKSDRVPSSKQPEYWKLIKLDGKKVGVIEETNATDEIKGILTESTVNEFATFSEAAEQLVDDDIEGFFVDEPKARYEIGNVSNATYIRGKLLTQDYGISVNKNNSSLLKKINKAIKTWSKSDKLTELADKWMDNRDATMETTTSTTAKDVIRVAAVTGEAPFSYVNANKELVGYDIELAKLLANEWGCQIEFVQTNQTEALKMVASGTVDFAVGGLKADDDADETTTFSDTTYDGALVAVVRTKAASEKTTFFTSIANSFKRTFVTENRWQMVLSGLGVTIFLSILSILFGTIGGFFFNFPMRSKNKVVRNLCSAVSTVINGLPLLIILMVFYYIIFSKTSMSGLWVGVIAFSMEFANTVAGILCTGIRAVSIGEIEAAEAMGYTKFQIFKKITLPQVALQMKTQYNKAVVGLVKGTAIVGYITIEDLTKVGDIIRSRTYDAFFPLIATAIIYFLLAQLLVTVLKKVEVGLDPKLKKRTVKGVDVHD